MGTVLYVMLVLATVALLGYGIYLLVRIARIYRRLRGLNLQRDYETMLYAALPGADVDEMAALIPDDVRGDLLAEVLERMAGDTGGELKDKVVRLYRELGYYDRRLREADKGRPSKREEARRRLAALGLGEEA